MKVEDIIGLNILDVLCEKFSNASTGFSTVMFKLTDCYLEFMVEESTDEIIAQIKSEIDEMKFYTPSWANTIKTKKLSQFWETQQAVWRQAGCIPHSQSTKVISRPTSVISRS